ncbi:response regulator transcription factor [Streptomyces bacillaris]|uniref:response regulator transcription factor n=1 Tax=Streptomyces bacillaris TaxID=68179 RepID=UPI00296F7E8B
MNESDIRVMIVDDEALIREGLRRIIDAFAGVRVVSVCAGEAAADQAEQWQPDLVLLDVRMPHCDGLSVLTNLRRLEHPPVVAMLTTFDVEEYLSAALHGGATGFLLKDTAPEQLEYAIRELVQGGSVIAPRAARTVIHGYVNRENQEGRENRQTLEDRKSPLGRATAAAESARPVSLIPARTGGGADPVGAAVRPAAESLTTREREVLELLAEGLSNTEIGKRLYIGTTTVKDHVSVLLGKLGVANRVQAAVRAHQQGLVGSVTAGMRRTA